MEAPVSNENPEGDAVDADGNAVDVGRVIRREPISRAIRAIEYLSEHPKKTFGVRELARYLHVSPSSAQRLVATMVEIGVLENARAGEGYGFSRDFVRTAKKIIGSAGYASVAADALTDLASASKETALFGEYDYRMGQMMFTDMAESEHPVRFVARLHEWLPVYVGASGLAILSFLPEHDRDRVMVMAERAIMAEKTPWKSVADVEAAMFACQESRYAISTGQRIPGAIGIFVPIFDQDRVVADIGLNIPEQRFRQNDMPAILRYIRHAAQMVQDRLE
jgi:DNA-binding IclR family transcriptional regulator